MGAELLWWNIETSPEHVGRHSRTLEFKFGRSKSSNKKGICKDTGIRKAENNVDPLLSKTADLVTKGVEKAKILSAFFASFVIGCPRSESSDRNLWE